MDYCTKISEEQLYTLKEIDALLKVFSFARFGCEMQSEIQTLSAAAEDKLSALIAQLKESMEKELKENG